MLLRCERRGEEPVKAGICSLASTAAIVGIGAGAKILFGGDSGGGGGGGSQPQQPTEEAKQATLESIEASKQARAMGQDLFDYHKTNYRPLEQQAIDLASKAGSPEEQELKAGQAGATVQQQFQNTDQARKLRQAQLGSKPDSGNSQEMDRESAIAEAGSEAGAMNLARQNERAYGLSAKTAVADVGRNITSNAIGADNAAANAAQVGIQGARASQAIRDQQNANIGSAIPAIFGGLNTLQKNGVFGTTNPNVTPVNTVNMSGGDSQYGNNTDLYQQDFSAGYYRKGGLVKPPRRSEGYIKGGKVVGPGTGTSDSVPVMIDGNTRGALSNDEYVINAKAAKKHGLKKLDAINEKGLPRNHVMKNGTPVNMARGGKVEVHDDHEDDDDHDDRGHEYAKGGMVARRSLTRPSRHQGVAHG